MKAEDFLKQNYNITAHKDPEWYGLEISQAMQEYHQSKLQALKEEVEELDSTMLNLEELIPKKEVLNLITKAEDK